MLCSWWDFVSYHGFLVSVVLALSLARIPIKMTKAPASIKTVVAASDMEMVRGRKRSTLSGIAAKELAFASEPPIKSAPASANVVIEPFVLTTLSSIFGRLACRRSAALFFTLFFLQKTRSMQPITERALYPPNNRAKIAEHLFSTIRHVASRGIRGKPYKTIRLFVMICALWQSSNTSSRRNALALRVDYSR